MLTAAKGFEVLVLEANDRIGGRIKTVTATTGVTVEMGATWFKEHTNLLALVHEFNIPYFRQHTQGFLI
jgi:monoamine oxidase